MSSYQEKINAHTPEQYTRLLQLADDANRQAEADKKRVCSNFGYRHGGMPIMFVWMFAPAFTAVFAVIGFAIYANAHPAMSFNTRLAIMDWMVWPPFPFFFGAPFVFLKLRYALRGLLIILLIMAFAILCFHGLDVLIEHLTD